jgi:hypothetical protein
MNNGSTLNPAQIDLARKLVEMSKPIQKEMRGMEQTIYIALFRGQHDKEWSCDGVYSDRAIADAKNNYESLRYPQWTHVVVEAKIPAIEGGKG